MAPRDCAVWGAAHSRQSTTKDLDFKREFREKRTTPPEWQSLACPHVWRLHWHGPEAAERTGRDDGSGTGGEVRI